MARFKFGRPISLRWNGLLIEGPAETVFEIPDEFYEEFNQDIGTVEPTIVWLDADEAATLRGRVTALEVAGSGAPLSTTTPLALGTAAVGTQAASSHGDHVHPTTGLALSGHNHNGTYATTTHAHAESDVTSLVSDLADKVSKTIVDAKGDLIVGTAADTVSRLAVSATNGHVLSADSTTATGLAWVAQSGGGGGASLSDSNALALGTAAPGTAATASRYDHVHPTTGVSLTGHTHDTAGSTSVVRQYVKNDSTAKVKGDVVYISDADGTNPIVSFSDADAELTSSKTLGLLMQNLAANEFGYVITEGILSGIDTSAASVAGVTAWLSGTSGKMVFGAPPAEPAHGVYLGVVTKKNASTGEIFVKVQNGYELDELHDVSAASPTDGDLIQYVSSTGLWTKKSISAAGISATHSHPYEASGAVSTHNAATTSVHGISNTANLLTTTHVDTDVATTSLHHTIGTTATTAAAGNHAHTGVYEVSGTTSTHAGLTTTVHGISNTANLVYTSDSRLTDARTPSSTLAHASTHLSGGTDALSGISPSQVTGTAVVTADSRLSDSRTPTAHKTSHATGGSDALAPSDIGAAPIASPTFTGTVTTPNATISTLTTAGYVKNSAAGVLSSSSAIPQADVTSLTSDLALKAPLASPTFTGNVTVNAQGNIRFADADSSNYVGFQAPATITANKVWILPAADGTANQALVTNGSGTLSFATPSGGGMTLLATLNGATTSLVVTSIPSTYKDLYIRVFGSSTSTAVGISSMTLSTGNFSSIYQGVLKIDNDQSYTTTTLEGVIANSTTSTATKDFPISGSSMVETDNATYGSVLEITIFDYANASGLNNSKRFFRHTSISPNGASTPTNASFIVGSGNYTLATSTAAITGLTVNNAGAVAMTAFVYGVS